MKEVTLSDNEALAIKRILFSLSLVDNVNEIDIEHNEGMKAEYRRMSKKFEDND